MATRIFCCTSVQPYRPQVLDHESKFKAFINWSQNVHGVDSPSLMLTNTPYCIQIVRQVNYGPQESIRYFITNGSENGFAEIEEDQHGTKSELLGIVAFDALEVALRSAGRNVPVDLKGAWAFHLTESEVTKLVLDCNHLEGPVVAELRKELDDVVTLVLHDMPKPAYHVFNGREYLVGVLRKMAQRKADDKRLEPLISCAIEVVYGSEDVDETQDDDNVGLWPSDDGYDDHGFNDSEPYTDLTACDKECGYCGHCDY